jgi:transposase
VSLLEQALKKSGVLGASGSRSPVVTVGFAAAHLIADRGYDTNAIVEQAQQHNTKPVISPKKHRREQRDYDRYLYKLRHLIENAFMKLKGWRVIATRFAKRTSSYLAAVQIRCIFLWTQIS